MYSKNVTFFNKNLPKKVRSYYTFGDYYFLLRKINVLKLYK